MTAIELHPDTPIVLIDDAAEVHPETRELTPGRPSPGVWIVRYRRLDGYVYATRPHRPGQPGIIVFPNAARIATSDEYAAALGLPLEQGEVRA